MADELQHQVWEACRALGTYGLGSGIGGHVSVRVPGERRYWTNALDRSFEEMTVDDIVLLDFEGNNLSGGRVVSPGIGFHPGIYELRADVGAIVHTHGYWVTAQAAFGRPPKPWHNLATYFHGRTAVSPDDTVEAIAPALGPDDVAIIIPWHGSITIGPSMEEAAALHVTFDYACQLDVTLAGSGAEPLSDDACVRIQALLGTADYLHNTWELMRRKAERAVSEAGRPVVVG
ncbi:MAG TPA: class II aldolase/adducin family protein [Acidimicrobiales bacterium]|nr:class II aldolase/adducin family protein [Acidimicrobiales bacterium]